MPPTVLHPDTQLPLAVPPTLRTPPAVGTVWKLEPGSAAAVERTGGVRRVFLTLVRPDAVKVAEVFSGEPTERSVLSLVGARELLATYLVAGFRWARRG